MSEQTSRADGGAEASNVADDAPNVAVEDVSPAAYARRTVAVDFLFLDRESCARCAGTEGSLESAVDRVAGLLGDLGVDLAVRRVHVADADAARLTGLTVSPTIRVNGRDVQPAHGTSPCADCGDLCGRAGPVDCRTWTHRGETREVAPVELLVEEILRAALKPDETETVGALESASGAAGARATGESRSRDETVAARFPEGSDDAGGTDEDSGGDEAGDDDEGDGAGGANRSGRRACC